MWNEHIKRTIIVVFIFVCATIAGLGIYSHLYPDNPYPDIPLAPGTFEPPSDEVDNFTLGIGWQMISMPTNVNKSKILYYIN